MKNEEGVPKGDLKAFCDKHGEVRLSFLFPPFLPSFDSLDETGTGG